MLVVMSDTVIKVENISKFYQLGLINHGTLAKDLQGWWAKIRGKEDPNSRISMLSSAKNNSDNDFIYALKDVSFDVKQGEVLGIIGANGAGKSTLLKILSRVTSPTSGCIKIKGRIGSLLEVGTGFHPELTGRENIYLNGAILGMRKHEIDRKLDEIIDFSGVEKFIDTPVKRYSSGMYVRLAFAVAAHLDPEILVVDEVLAVGDADFQKKCLGKMGDVSKKEGRTVLFVSHNMVAVKQLCDRSLIIEKGSIIFDGDCGEAIDKYTTDEMSEFNKFLPSVKRYGSGEAKIVDFIVDPKKPECAKEIKFTFVINSSCEIKDASCAVSFRDSMGNLLFQFFSENMNKTYVLKPGINKISVSVPQCPLVEGIYRSSLWLGKNSKNVLDFCEDSLFLKVFYNQEGKFIDNRKYHIIFDSNWSD